MRLLHRSCLSENTVSLLVYFESQRGVCRLLESCKNYEHLAVEPELNTCCSQRLVLVVPLCMDVFLAGIGVPHFYFHVIMYQWLF
jgi:hypothetical protein